MSKASIRSEISLRYEEVIWNNRKILINGKPVFYKSWSNQNIIRIQDLLQEDGKFLSFKNLTSPSFSFLLILYQRFGGYVSEIPPSRCPDRQEKEETNSTKYVYNLLSKKFFVLPTAETKILKHGFTPKTVQSYLSRASVTLK